MQSETEFDNQVSTLREVGGILQGSILTATSVPKANNHELARQIYEAYQQAEGKEKTYTALAIRFNIRLASGEPNHHSISRAILHIEHPERYRRWGIGKSKKDKIWTKEDVKFLRSLVKDRKSAKDISLIIARSSEAIRRKVERISMKFRKPKKIDIRLWTQEEVSLLKENVLQGKYVCDISKLINRSEDAIRSRCKKLGIKCQKNPNTENGWNEQEVTLLKDLVSQGKYCYEINRIIINHQKAGIRDKCRRLGLDLKKQRINEKPANWEEIKKEKLKQYQIKNREKLLEMYKKSYKKNKEKYREKRKIWRLTHKELRAKLQCRYRNNHPEIFKSSSYMLRRKMQVRIHVALRIKKIPKTKKTMQLLGCDIITLRNHLELQFKDGMSWENYGRKGWVVDHVMPITYFDLNKEEEQLLCFNFHNLQPMWEINNLIKNNTLPDNSIEFLQKLKLIVLGDKNAGQDTSVSNPETS